MNSRLWLLNQVSMCGVALALTAVPAAAQNAGASPQNPELPAQSEAAQTPSAPQAADRLSGTALDEIVVTARKQSETTQSIPETVRAIGATELANAHVTRIDDLGSLVSNLNITTRADQSPDVVIRGVGAFGITNGVGFYLDDVQLFDGETIRPTDLDRVEVLKGPQGTLYGGNNIGGAIKYVSKLPTDTLHADGMFEYGQYNTVTASAAVSGPLIGDVVTARLSAFGTRTSGYAYDPVLDKKLDRGKEYGGRATFQVKGDGTTAVLYLNADVLDTGASSLYYRPGPPNDPAAASNYSLEISDGTEPHFKRTLYSATLSLDHKLADNLDLISISSYFHSTAHTISDVDKGPLPFLTGYQTFKHSVWSQELRLSRGGGGAFKWIIGAFAQGNDPDTLQRNVQFIGDPPSPANLADPTQFAQQQTLVKERHREYAVFGNAQLKLGQFDLEFGLRGDYSKVAATDPLYGLALSEHSTQVVPKLSASYHFNRNVMAYGLVSRGFQAGGVTEEFDANGAPFFSKFQPETTWNYELGVKSNLGHGAHLNVAAFYLDYRNRLFPSFAFQGAQFVQTTTNIGPSKNYGVETDLSFRLIDRLILTASAGFTRADWGNIPFVDPDGYGANGVQVIGADGNPVPQQVNLKGRTAPFTPAYQGSLSLDWSHNLSSDLVLGLRADATAFGRTYWDVTDHYQQHPYRLVNLGARLERKAFTLSAHVSNVFDRRYNTTFISAAEVGAPNNVAGVGRPRLWTAALSFRY
ncbi:TonB-dependent receptor [uncultured Sphingomonas sp.]|uniref:TonB-dependent receptor n=1 Tax=uncultured Sphingomonas sp. TaxID=158754 RepID=UPI0035CA9F8F